MNEKIQEEDDSGMSWFRIGQFRKKMIQECANIIVNDPDYAVEAGTDLYVQQAGNKVYST